MKVFAIVMCALLVGANAGVLDDLKTQLSGLGDAFKATAAHITTNSKMVFQGLLEQLKQAGGQLLTSSAQKLLEQLATTAPGKRDLAMLEKLQGGMEFLNEHFETAKEQVHEVIETSMEKLHQTAEKIMTLDFLKMPKEQIMAEIDQAIAHHKDVTTGFMKNVVHDLLTKMRPAPQKRFLRDSYQKLVDFLKPHIQKVNDGVKSVGDQLKEHITNLSTAVQTSSTDLKNKLGVHVDQLKGHAQNIINQGGDAFNALKSAVTDILKQTVTNVAGTAKEGIQKTISDGANTITQHLINALKKDPAVQKRFLKDSYQKLLDFLKPHVQKVGDGFKSAQEQLKQHISNLNTAVQTSTSDLKDKLGVHVDELKGHAKNIINQGGDAFNALKSAVTDILKQTVTNVTGTAKQGIQKTITDGANTITQHLIDAIKKEQ